jgi:hypothetical protein
MLSIRRVIVLVILVAIVIVSAVVIYNFESQPSNQSNLGTNPFTNSGHTPSNSGSPIQSVANIYLQSQGNASRIYVVSANASYGTYPYPTVTVPPNFNSGKKFIAENGEPCVIINVTLRNDYSAEYPAPNPSSLNNTTTKVYISLTAQLSNSEGQVDSTDITNAGYIASATTNSAFTSLNYGQSTTVTLYMATSNTNITSFQLIPRYIGAQVPT